jgi:hypothetical protein
VGSLRKRTHIDLFATIWTTFLQAHHRKGIFAPTCTLEMQPFVFSIAASAFFRACVGTLHA